MFIQLQRPNTIAREGSARRIYNSPNIETSKILPGETGVERACQRPTKYDEERGGRLSLERSEEEGERRGKVPGRRRRIQV